MRINNMFGLKKNWKYPPLSLLSDKAPQKADRGDIKKIAEIIEETLQKFAIEVRVVEVNLGPIITQYVIEFRPGTKLSTITELADDLALANKSFENILLSCLFQCKVMKKAKSKLIVPLGLDASGNSIVVDIAGMPHTLIAGTTGSGKSVLINSFITSLLFRASPNELKLI